MPSPQDYRAFFRENDTTSQREYWGEAAAGCLFVAKDTGKILIAHRSDRVDYEPETWGTWGGKIDMDESPKQAVEREVEEETGFSGQYKIHPLYTYQDGEFKYYNYLVVVPFEFTPQLNWENDNSSWVEFGDWPTPMHFGLEELIKHAGHKIRRVIDLVKQKKDNFLKEDASNSENFKQWFGNSVVRKPDGSPLVVYHGTNQPISSFSKLRRGMSTNAGSARKAYFFTDSPEVADKYAANAARVVRSDVSKYEKTVKEFQKQIERLERVARATGNWEPYERAVEEYEKYDIDTMREDDIIGQNVLPVYLRIENPAVHDFEGMGINTGGLEDLVTAAIKNGNDGLILKNIIDPEPVSNHYVVFKPTQIKSAIGNKGEFNPKKSDITKEVMDVPPQSQPAHVQPAVRHSQTTNVVDQQKLKDAYVVIATLWGEARGEGEVGMQAVMNVIMNRCKGDFNKARGVVLKRKQFSIWNGVPDPEASSLKLAQGFRNKEIKDSASYLKAVEIVDKAMKGSLPDITDGATFYFNPHKVFPKWAKSMVKIKTIGNHDFYKLKSKAQRLNESVGGYDIKRQGIVDDGVIGYEITSPHSTLKYGYDAHAKIYHLYMIATPKVDDREKGYAKELLEYFFQMIKQSGGVLNVESYTGSGMDFIKPLVQRFSKQYGVRVV